MFTYVFDLIAFGLISTAIYCFSVFFDFSPINKNWTAATNTYVLYAIPIVFYLVYRFLFSASNKISSILNEKLSPYVGEKFLNVFFLLILFANFHMIVCLKEIQFIAFYLLEQLL